MHRFYAPSENIGESEIALGVDETRHLRDVVRLRPGDEVSVFNGQGREFLCSIVTIDKKASRLLIDRELKPASPESGFELTLAAAMLKGDKFDLVVQKAVELGVSAIIPLRTMRCDKKLEGSSRRLERWRRIALEATKQCGRARLMSIAEPAGLDEVISGTEKGETMMFSERGGEGFDAPKALHRLTAVVGPEGGWDDTELEHAAENGVAIVTLGGRTLRAETAAIAVTAILQHRFGDIN